jgi:hypothetical protein
MSLLLLIILLNTQCVDIDDAVAGNDACSFVWGISGGFDAIDSSYGPIGSAPWLGSGGGGEEGKQNMGNAEAILGGQNDRFKGERGLMAAVAKFGKSAKSRLTWKGLTSI